MTMDPCSLIDADFRAHPGMSTAASVCARNNLDVEKWNSYMTELRERGEAPVYEDVTGQRVWGYPANRQHEWTLILQRSRPSYNLARKSVLIFRGRLTVHPTDFDIQMKLADSEAEMKRQYAWIEKSRRVLRGYGVKTYAPKAMI